METKAEDRQRAIDENYEAFSQLLPELMKQHAGRFVVMRSAQPQGFFDTSRDALIHASRTYEDSLFSVQEITQKPIDLGWFSYANLHRGRSILNAAPISTSSLPSRPASPSVRRRSSVKIFG